jgi:hypothetical protein
MEKYVRPSVKNLGDLGYCPIEMTKFNNPIDILYRIHKIEPVFADETSDSVRYVKTFDSMFVGWKLLFIAAQIPDLQRLFEFIGKWKKLDCVPHLFAVTYKVPRAVLKHFLNDATRARSSAP